MGLTVYYDYDLPADRRRAREVVGELHRFAAERRPERLLPIEEADFDEAGRPRGDADPGLARLYGAFPVLTGESDESGEENYVSVRPRAVIHFVVKPPGAETAPFGLASHPGAVRVGEGDAARELSTGRAGLWSWHSGCKTQYAGLPARGGPDNFLRAHLLVIALLDRLAELGASVRVRDGGGYWDHRDEGRLLERFEEWNEIVAAIGGRLRDSLEGAAGGGIVTPIMDRPDFERLEARGEERIARRRRDRPPPE